MTAGYCKDATQLHQAKVVDFLQCVCHCFKWQKVKRKSQIICHYKWHPDKQQQQVLDWGKTEEQLRFDSIITSSKLPLLWASAINLLRHHA